MLKSLIIYAAISFLLASTAKGQSVTVQLVPSWGTQSSSGDGGFALGANSGTNPAYCDVSAWTHGHYTSLGEYQATTVWTLTITCTSSSQPTVNSGSTYTIGDSEESDTWADITGPSGYATATATTPLTSAYSYWPGDVENDSDDDSTPYDGDITGVTWTNVGSTWTGTLVIVNTSSYSYGYINRSYSGSSGDGGEGDTYIDMSFQYTLNITTH